jgi:hypothetical protein
MEVFVVISRDDSDFIYVTTDSEKADKARVKQTTEEEMSGGRPSVYIRKTKLN